MNNKSLGQDTPAGREELIKKLEGIDYPDIEPAFHKQQLKRALLKAAEYPARNSRLDNFRVPTLAKVMVPTITVVIIALIVVWKAGLFSGGPIGVTPASTLAGSSQMSLKAPELLIFEPMDNATFDSSFVKVLGKTYPNAVVSINDRVTISNDRGDFYADLDLDDGFNVIQITASDDSGNQSSTTIVANVDEGVSDEVY
jgi:hypothetical protein